MAKFTHLSRLRRDPQSHSNSHSPARSPAPPPKAAPPDPNRLGGVPGGANSAPSNPSELSDAEFLIRRVSGSCGSKAAYVTRSEVTTYLRQTGYTGTPYSCQFCGLWHATTMTRKAQKALTRRVRAAKKLLDQSIPPSQ